MESILLVSIPLDVEYFVERLHRITTRLSDCLRNWNMKAWMVSHVLGLGKEQFVRYMLYYRDDSIIERASWKTSNSFTALLKILNTGYIHVVSFTLPKSTILPLPPLFIT